MLNAHLMIFWFTQLATITPPVCMTAFAAASIAKARPMNTGFRALKFGAPFYYIPILFVYSNILDGPIMQKVVLLGVAGVAIFFLASVLEGFILAKMSIVMRGAALAVFCLLYASVFRSGSTWIHPYLLAAGLVIGLGILWMQNRAFRRSS